MVVVGGIRDWGFWGGLKERIWVLMGLDQGFWWMLLWGFERNLEEEDDVGFFHCSQPNHFKIAMC